ncbi:MAG: hypothetical protein IKQ10_07200 [Oscillospiraceae bacterium]|nr:hypothetical protein [Oscillospiraceae bacterium]
MQRKLTALILCALMLLTLAACGGGKSPSEAPEATAGPAADATEAPSNHYTYADIYTQYLTVSTALIKEVQGRMDAHNSVLEKQYPDSYYMNSNYLLLVYAPFTTVYPALGRGLTSGDIDLEQTALRAAFPDAVLSRVSDSRWEARYTYTDRTSGEPVERAGRCVWEYDSALGSFRVCGYVDGEMTEFTEFVPQGNDLYLLYTATDKALVRFTAGQITAIWHAHRISEPPLGAFAGDMRLCSLEEKDCFPDGTAGVSWITSDADAQYILTLENGAMQYTGKVARDLPDAAGERVGIEWMDIEPITLLE